MRLQTQKECHFIKNPFSNCCLGLKTQCTTKSVEMAYSFDHLLNLKPLNLPFKQEIRIFYTKRLTRTWTMLWERLIYKIFIVWIFFCLFTVCSFENSDSHFTGFIVILDFVCLTKNIHYSVSTYFHLRIIPFSKLVLWPLIKVSILGVESLLPFQAWLFLACKKRSYFIQ